MAIYYNYKKLDDKKKVPRLALWHTYHWLWLAQIEVNGLNQVIHGCLSTSNSLVERSAVYCLPCSGNHMFDSIFMLVSYLTGKQISQEIPRRSWSLELTDLFFIYYLPGL